MGPVRRLARRAGSARASLRALGLAVVLVAAGAAPAVAQGALSVPYTVQVAALSDAEAAIELSGVLLRDGFPAYVVRAEGAAGPVFRVRVAAFGDRVSADRYAVALGARRGGDPQPALAEAIPSGILPLSPLRVARIEGDARAVALPWGDDVIVRVGPEDQRAAYRPSGSGEPFEAWWAVRRDDGGREEVARVALDDPAATEDAPAVRDALFRQRLRLVADQVGVDEATLGAEAVRGEPGERHLVAWRTTGDGGGVRSVARADASPASREPDAWLGDVPPDAPAPLLVIRPGPSAPVTDAAQEAPRPGAAGEGWTAVADDGAWTVLTVGQATWRALVGTPVVGAGDLLVVRVDGGTELVRLLRR